MFISENSSQWLGRHWCYVSYNTRDQCRDTRISRSGRAYSFEACITPAVGSSRCTCLANNGLSTKSICNCMCPPGSPQSCFDTWCPQIYERKG